MKHLPAFVLAALASSVSAQSIVPPSQLISHPPYPALDESAYVLLEIWGGMKDITLNAYFLDGNAERNRNLCAATRLDLMKAGGAEKGNKPTTYWLCLTLHDAISQGYVQGKP
jgi:hypothetical protein